MTDAERPFVNVDTRIREAQARSRRDDGALVALARVIGEKCGVASPSTGPSDNGSAKSDRSSIAHPSLPPPIEKEPAAAGPDHRSQRTELPRFAPAYRKISQRIKIDWEFGSEQRVSAKSWRPTGTPLRILQMRSASNPQSYRSLPDVLPVNGEGFDGFDIGKRFLIQWPEQRLPRRVNDYVKVAVSVGVIAAAIAGFWGGSVIKAGRGEVIGSLSEPKETSALPAGRAIRVVSTDSVKPGNGSPFGGGPSAFVADGQGTLLRPSATTMAVITPDFNDGISAPTETVPPKSPSSAAVAPATSVPSTPSAAIETTVKGSIQQQPLAALATGLPAPASPTPSNPPIPTGPVASAGAAASPDSAPVMPSNEAASGSAKGLSQSAVHGARPVKKRNPLAIVRFSSQGTATGRAGPRPPGSVPQPASAAVQHDDSFLTRFLDNILKIKRGQPSS
jgi:hypothetical protein